MPASGTSTASRLSSIHDRRSQLLFFSLAILFFVHRYYSQSPGLWVKRFSLRQHVGARYWRGIFYVIISGHMLRYDRDDIVLLF